MITVCPNYINSLPETQTKNIILIERDITLSDIMQMLATQELEVVIALGLVKKDKHIYILNTLNETIAHLENNANVTRYHYKNIPLSLKNTSLKSYEDVHGVMLINENTETIKLFEQYKGRF